MSTNIKTKTTTTTDDNWGKKETEQLNAYVKSRDRAIQKYSHILRTD